MMLVMMMLPQGQSQEPWGAYREEEEEKEDLNCLALIRTKDYGRN